MNIESSIKAIFQLLLFVLFTTTGISQNEESIKSILKNINSIDQVDSLAKAFPFLDIKIWRTPAKGFYSDSTILNTEIAEICKTTDINKEGIYIIKVLERKKEEHCKVQYIFFHGFRTKQELDSIRAIVLDKYANGIDFNTLHKLYNEDGSPDGILDWFCEGIMVKEFDSSVRKRKKNEIFKVDVPELQWYYVVLKLKKNRMMNVTHSIGIKVN